MLAAENPNEVIRLQGHVDIGLQNGQLVSLYAKNHTVIVIAQSAGANTFTDKIGVLADMDGVIVNIGILLGLAFYKLTQSGQTVGAADTKAHAD